MTNTWGVVASHGFDLRVICVWPESPSKNPRNTLSGQPVLRSDVFRFEPFVRLNDDVRNGFNRDLFPAPSKHVPRMETISSLINPLKVLGAIVSFDPVFVIRNLPALWLTVKRHCDQAMNHLRILVAKRDSKVARIVGALFHDQNLTAETNFHRPTGSMALNDGPIERSKSSETACLVSTLKARDVFPDFHEAYLIFAPVPIKRFIAI